MRSNQPGCRAGEVGPIAPTASIRSSEVDLLALKVDPDFGTKSGVQASWTALLWGPKSPVHLVMGWNPPTEVVPKN